LDLGKSVLIDFGDQNKGLAEKVKHYMTFNTRKDLKEAMKSFYDKLREAENLPDIETILISHLDKEGHQDYEHFDFYDTLKDKIKRCT